MAVRQQRINNILNVCTPELCLFLIRKLRQMTLQATCMWSEVGLSQPCVRHRLSLAVVSCSRLLSPGGTLLQHQHRFPMLLKPHRVSFNILKVKCNARGWWHSQGHIHAICGPSAHRNKLTTFIHSWKNLNSMRHAYVTQTHLEDANEILFINTEKMTVVFSQDDGGGTRSIIQQS